MSAVTRDDIEAIRRAAELVRTHRAQIAGIPGNDVRETPKEDSTSTGSRIVGIFVPILVPFLGLVFGVAWLIRWLGRTIRTFRVDLSWTEIALAVAGPGLLISILRLWQDPSANLMRDPLGIVLFGSVTILAAIAPRWLPPVKLIARAISLAFGVMMLGPISFQMGWVGQAPVPSAQAPAPAPVPQPQQQPQPQRSWIQQMMPDTLK